MLAIALLAKRFCGVLDRRQRLLVVACHFVLWGCCISVALDVPFCTQTLILVTAV
jgi:hypothetical protein